MIDNPTEVTPGRKRYTSPRLQACGSFASITQGASGSKNDGGGTKAKTT